MSEEKRENSSESMDISEMVQVGKVRDSHGLKGELFIVNSLEAQPKWIHEIEEYSLVYQAPTETGKHETKTQIFKVVKTRTHKKGFIVKSKEIQSRTESDRYIGAEFYISKKYLKTQEGESPYLYELKDNEVLVDQKTIGRVSGFGSNGAQDLLIVQTEEGEIEIPFVDAFVENLDRENKKIYMKLPEGLLNLENEEPS